MTIFTGGSRQHSFVSVLYQNITQKDKIRVSGVLRTNDCGVRRLSAAAYGCALLLLVSTALLLTFALDELAVKVRLQSTRTHLSSD